MAADKFVKSVLILFFLVCVVRNGFCAPIEDAVMLNDGTVLKRVIEEAVSAPPPRIDSALDAKKDKDELVIVIQEVQSAPPPRIMSKRDAEDEGDYEDGDDDTKTNEPTFLPTATKKSDEASVKTSTPGVAIGAQATTVLDMQTQNSNENKNGEKSKTMFSESPKSETQQSVDGQAAGDADKDADENRDNREQKSTIQTAIPTRAINDKDGSEASGLKDESRNQGDTKNDADNKGNNTVRNGVNDQSNKIDDEPSDKTIDEEPSDASTKNKPLIENNFDKTTPYEGSEELIDTDENDKLINEEEGDFNEDEDINNHNAEVPIRNGEEEEEEEEEPDDEGEPIELDRSSVTKKNNVSESQSSGHFMSYFLIAVVFVACFYLIFHNRQKIKAYVLEGKNGRGRRRKAGGSEYRQLSTAEEVLPSADKGMESKTTYTY